MPDWQATQIDEPKQVDRIAFFSDAVFAIAITLLALELRLPAGVTDVGRALADLAPRYVSFGISFAVIGMFWIAHHRLFAYIRRYDRRLLYLNLALLLCIVVLPFPTSLIGEHNAADVSVIVYALWVALTGLASASLSWYALGGGRMTSPGLAPGLVRALIWRHLIVALVFVASLPLVAVGHTLAELSWLAVIPLETLVTRRLLAAGRPPHSGLPTSGESHGPAGRGRHVA